jgi:hypothetical protein
VKGSDEEQRWSQSVTVLLSFVNNEKMAHRKVEDDFEQDEIIWPTLALT